MRLRDTNPNGSTWSIFDTWYGTTIQPIKHMDNYPKWSPMIQRDPRVYVSYCDIQNDADCIHTLPQQTCDVITADCGIDVTKDYHNQEVIMYPLLLR